MRLKISLDVRKPLKRKKKITCRIGKEFVVQCKYERLGEFCFICGVLSHTDRFCQKFLINPGENVVKEWGAWLRAPPRRLAGQNKNKWLRDDGDGGWDFKIGKSNDDPKLREAVMPTDNAENIQR